jgi:hypothetical protein
MTSDRRIEPLLVRFRGVDQRGMGRQGCTATQTPLQITESLYEGGWRSAKVCLDGEVVGEIKRNDEGVRVWWAER